MAMGWVGVGAYGIPTAAQDSPMEASSDMARGGARGHTASPQLLRALQGAPASDMAATARRRAGQLAGGRSIQAEQLAAGMCRQVGARARGDAAEACLHRGQPDDPPELQVGLSEGQHLLLFLLLILILPCQRCQAGAVVHAPQRVRGRRRRGGRWGGRRARQARAASRCAPGDGGRRAGDALGLKTRRAVLRAVCGGAAVLAVAASAGGALARQERHACCDCQVGKAPEPQVTRQRDGACSGRARHEWELAVGCTGWGPQRSKRRRQATRQLTAADAHLVQGFSSRFHSLRCGKTGKRGSKREGSERGRRTCARLREAGKPAVAEGGVVQGQKHSEGCEVSDVHAHGLAGGRVAAGARGAHRAGGGGGRRFIPLLLTDPWPACSLGAG